MPAQQGAPAEDTALTPRQIAARARTPWRKYVYTPGLLADLRRRYEETPETCRDIAARHGISHTALRKKAQEQGWVKFSPRVFDLSAAEKLDAQLARAEQSLPSAPLPQDTAESKAAEVFDLTAEAALREAQKLVEALSAAREQMVKTGDHLLAAQLGRELNAITNALYRLRHVRGAVANQGFMQNDSDRSDLDARRDALARRIEAILAEWMDAETAGQADRA